MSTDCGAIVGVGSGGEHARLMESVDVAALVTKAENILHYNNAARLNSGPVVAFILKSAVGRILFIGFLTAVKQINFSVYRNEHEILPWTKNCMFKPFFGAERLVDEPASTLKIAFSCGVLCGEGEHALFRKEKGLVAEHAEAAL